MVPNAYNNNYNTTSHVLKLLLQTVVQLQGVVSLPLAHESPHHGAHVVIGPVVAVVVVVPVVPVVLVGVVHLGEHIVHVHVVILGPLVLPLLVHHAAHHLHHVLHHVAIVHSVHHLMIKVVPVLSIWTCGVAEVVMVLVVAADLLHHLHHHHELHHLVKVLVLAPAVGHADQAVGEPVHVSEGRQVQLGGVLLHALGHGLLHVEGEQLHVVLAPAALHGLALGPLHEHLVVLAGVGGDRGHDGQHQQHLHLQ